MTEQTKKLSFAYPSSPQAVRHGHAKTGCWIVEIVLHPLDAVHRYVASYVVKRDAISRIHEIEMPLDKYSHNLSQ